MKALILLLCICSIGTVRAQSNDATSVRELLPCANW